MVFARTNENLRSPLIHPISILMISFLNDTFPIMPDDFWSNLNDAVTVKESLTYKSCNVRDGIFASALKHWETSDSEISFTQQIVVNIKLRIEKNELPGYKYKDENGVTTQNTYDNVETLLTIKSEDGYLNICMPNKKPCTSSEMGDDERKNSVVMLTDFGIGHDIWWKKMDQILRYVEILLCANKDSNCVFDQPILLTIVTVNTQSKRNETTASDDSTASSTNDDVTVADENDNDEANDVNIADQKEPTVDINRETDSNITSSSTNATTGNVEEQLDVRFGVFLCTPRHSGDDDDNEYRVALLWRKDTSTVEDASKQFGKILHAAQLCADWREQFDEKFMKPNNGKKALYEYLGPHCCRIGTSVSSYFFPM